MVHLRRIFLIFPFLCLLRPGVEPAERVFKGVQFVHFTLSSIDEQGDRNPAPGRPSPSRATARVAPTIDEQGDHWHLFVLPRLVGWGGTTRLGAGGPPFFPYVFFLLRLQLILRFLCGSHANVQSKLRLFTGEGRCKHPLPASAPPPPLRGLRARFAYLYQTMFASITYNSIIILIPDIRSIRKGRFNESNESNRR